METIRSPTSDFGSWQVEETMESWQSQHPRTRSDIRNKDNAEGCQSRRKFRGDVGPASPPPLRQRPAAATVRVPYMPSHVIGAGVRPRPRPRSAAPSYMRATFAADSALHPSKYERRRHLSQYMPQRGTSKPVTADCAAKYVLEEREFPGSSRMTSRVPRPRQAFGVRSKAQTVDDDHNSIKQQSNYRRTGRLRLRRPASAPVRRSGRYNITASRNQSHSSHPFGAGEGLRSACGINNVQAASLASPTSYEDSQSVAQYPLQRINVSSLASATPWGVTAEAGIRPKSTPVRRRAAWTSDRFLHGDVMADASRRPGQAWSLTEVTEFGALGPDAFDTRTRNICDPRWHHQQPRKCLLDICSSTEQRIGSVKSKRERAQDKWVGLLEYDSSSAVMSGVHNSGGGGALAISPSPWGAFAGGPARATTISTAAGRSKQRPRSAPRPSFSGECGDRARARPRSAYAAPPSQCATSRRSSGMEHASDRRDGITERVSNCSEDEAHGRTSSLVRCVMNGVPVAGRRAARGARHNFTEVPALNAGKIGHTKQSVKRVSPVVRDAELIVVADPAGLNLGILSTQKGACTSAGATHMMGMPIAPAFWPRMRPAPVASSPVRGHKGSIHDAHNNEEGNGRDLLGLFGSALVPAGNGKVAPWDWTSTAIQRRASFGNHGRGDNNTVVCDDREAIVARATTAPVAATTAAAAAAPELGYKSKRRLVARVKPHAAHRSRSAMLMLDTRTSSSDLQKSGMRQRAAIISGHLRRGRDGFCRTRAGGLVRKALPVPKRYGRHDGVIPESSGISPGVCSRPQ